MEINVGTYRLVNTIIQILIIPSPIQSFAAMEKTVEISLIANLPTYKPTSPKPTSTSNPNNKKNSPQIQPQNQNQISTHYTTTMSK